MPTIHVCSLAKLDETVEKTGARQIVTLLSDGTPMRRPQSVAPERHLQLITSDITAPMDGHILPSPHHIDALIGFVKRWDRVDPLVIHCWAGISRSTAAAFITASVLNPDLDEARLATRLRAASPSATPNPRLIALADHHLDRHGRMIAAIEAIGRGEDAFEGTPFELVFD
jgi:predicted protein tyrosine phosphatase